MSTSDHETASHERYAEEQKLLETLHPLVARALKERPPNPAAAIGGWCLEVGPVHLHPS